MTAPLAVASLSGLPATAAPPPGLPFVIATIGSRQIAAPMAALLEVADLGEITSLPLAPAWLLGVSNLRGTVLPVLDLAALLGWERTAPGNRALVLRDGQFGLAIAVDSVPAVRWLDRPAAGAADEPILVDQVAIDGRQTDVVNPDALLVQVRTGAEVRTGGR